VVTLLFTMGVHAQSRNACLIAESVKRAIGISGLDEPPEGRCEHQTRFPPSQTRSEAFLKLSLAVRSQDADQRGGDRQNGYRGVRFHWIDSKLTVDTVKRLANFQPTRIQVNVGPRQPEGFASSKPHRKRDRPQCVTTMVLGGVEETGLLVRA